jgi:hypothetical protein
MPILIGANIELRLDSNSQVEPKGIKQPITTYEIVSFGDKYNLH